jgi:hypothetical protein
VIQASQNDFEEFGVEPTTLEEMKSVRCNPAAIRLSRHPLASTATPSQCIFRFSHFIFFFFFSHFSTSSLRFLEDGGDAFWVGR